MPTPRPALAPEARVALYQLRHAVEALAIPPILLHRPGVRVADWPAGLTEETMGDDVKQIGLRLPSELVDRLEAAAEQATKLTGGLATITRSDVARVLLARTIEQLETELEQDAARQRKKP